MATFGFPFEETGALASPEVLDEPSSTGLAISADIQAFARLFVKFLLFLAVFVAGFGSFA